jgi:lipoate-protein ligase A
MEMDVMALKGFEQGAVPSTIRIFAWQNNCISIGYSQKIEEEIDLPKAKQMGWEVVQRPTGGGIVFHNLAEVSFSVITAIDDPTLPPGLIPSYLKVSEAVVEGLRGLGIEAEIRPQTKDQRPQTTGLCFSYPAEYEIVVGGKKIVGSAQKRTKKALLQQGSIFVHQNPDQVYAMLKKPYGKENAVCVEEVLGREVKFDAIAKALKTGFEKGLGVKFN